MPRNEDDDDDRPARPRKRRDADDAPPKRRRPADDDDERRPSSKSRRRDEDDEDRRPSSKSRRRVDDDDDYDDEPRSRSRSGSRPVNKQVSVLGIISLVKGGLALIASFIPCMGVFAYLPAGLALILGIIGLVVAKKSNGKQGTGLPIAGISVSAAAILIATIWLVVINAFSNKMEADAKKFEDARKSEVDAVKSAPAIRITADELLRQCKENPAKARTDYRGKLLEVTGRVREVDAGPLGSVELGPQGPNYIRGNLDILDRDRFSSVRVGSQIVIRGKFIDWHDVADFVQMNECILVR